MISVEFRWYGIDEEYTVLCVRLQTSTLQASLRQVSAECCLENSDLMRTAPSPPKSQRMTASSKANWIDLTNVNTRDI